MTYKVIINGHAKIVENVKRVIDKGDNFTFYNGNNEIVFIVNKSEYSSINKEG